MIAKFLLICALGLCVQNVISFETKQESKIDSLTKKNDAKIGKTFQSNGIHLQNEIRCQKKSLRDIDQLILRRGQSTLYCGKPTVEQLNCVGPYKYCSLNKINYVQCVNIGHNSRAGEGKVAWKCKTTQMPTGLRFRELDVQCERAQFSIDEVYEGTCALRYTLEDDSIGAGWIIMIIIIIIVSIIFFFVFCWKKICNNCNSTTVYTDHAPIIRTTVRPAANIYSIPVQPAVPVYYPPPGYSNTNVVFSGTSYRNDSYRNDDSYVATGYAGTSFRGDDDNNYSGDNMDTGFAGTSFR